MTLYSKISKPEYDNITTICDFVIDMLSLTPVGKREAIENALTTLYTIIGDYEDVNEDCQI